MYYGANTFAGPGPSLKVFVQRVHRYGKLPLIRRLLYHWQREAMGVRYGEGSSLSVIYQRIIAMITGRSRQAG